MVGSDHYFHMCCLFVCPSIRFSVPNFQNLSKQKKFKWKWWSPLAGLWVWPIGSLMTSVLLIHSKDPTVLAGCDHNFHTFVRPSVPSFQNIDKQNKSRVKITVGLWVWPSGSLMTPVLFFSFQRSLLPMWG